MAEITLEEARRRQQAAREAKAKVAKANGDWTTRRLRVTYLDELPKVGAQDRLVHGVLGENQLAMWFGESGSGKSFSVFDLSMHIALKWDWFGRRVTKGAVLYVAAENSGGWANRVEAFCRHHKIQAEDRKSIPVGFVLATVNLGRDGGDVDAIVSAVEELERRTGEKVRLIPIDTMARATPGSNENDPLDMGAFITKCDAIRQRTGATVLIVHHSGKNALMGARGHSSLRAAMDCEVEVERTNGHRLLRVRKNRDGLDGQEIGFVLTPVEIGRDEDDQKIMSCVVEAAEVVRTATLSEDRKKRAAAQLRAFMDAVRQGLDHHGKTIKPFADGPRLLAVDAKVVRSIYYTMRADDLAEASRKTVFNRHFKNAIDSQAVITRLISEVPMIWLPSKP